MNDMAQPRQRRLSSALSWTAARIEVASVKDGVDVTSAQATAFLWEHEGAVYLVTNLHNLAGWDYVRGKAMSDTGALPTEVRIHVGVALPPKQARIVMRSLLIDGDGEARWLVHPRHAHRVDVAALRIGTMDDILALWPTPGVEKSLLTKPVNTIEGEFTDYDISAGDDAYVLGYPLGIDGGDQFPIWKRASLASEPDLDVDGLPKALIDTATRKGMSGSPVIAVRRGMIPSKTGNFGDAIIGQVVAFLGVYSGRVDDDPLGAQLGIVWKAEVVEEIVKGGVRGNSRPWEA